MKHFFTILSHEIRMLLVSPSTYIAGVLFLWLMGFIFTDILEQFSKAAQAESPAAAGQEPPLVVPLHSELQLPSTQVSRL